MHGIHFNNFAASFAEKKIIDFVVLSLEFNPNPQLILWYFWKRNGLAHPYIKVCCGPLASDNSKDDASNGCFRCSCCCCKQCLSSGKMGSQSISFGLCGGWKVSRYRLRRLSSWVIMILRWRRKLYTCRGWSLACWIWSRAAIQFIPLPWLCWPQVVPAQYFWERIEGCRAWLRRGLHRRERGGRDDRHLSEHPWFRWV